MANEKRLIDADALFKAIKSEKRFFRFGVPNTLKLMFDYLHIIIKEQPTVDAVEVVRCKDCKHWLAEKPERCKALKQAPYGLCNIYPQRTDWQDTRYEEDFCSYGERRTDETDSCG